MATVQPGPADVIEIGSQFYIRAQSSLAHSQSRILLHSDTFGIFDQYGDIQPYWSGAQGLFHCDTRYLSKLELRISGCRPLLLSSSIRDDNILLSVDLTNPDLTLASGELLPRGTVHIHRDKFLGDGICMERLTIHNFSGFGVNLDLSLAFDADFADIFELRGSKRAQRGRRLTPEILDDSILLGYEGLDHIIRRTRIHCSFAPKYLSEYELNVPIALEPHQDLAFSVAIHCESNGSERTLLEYDCALAAVTGKRGKDPFAQVDIYSSNEQFNDWLNRSLADLQMLISNTALGPYPYAGVPWFSTAFGRDGIITGLETLWIAPALAKGVLGFLAATQATTKDAHRDSEPGKILHETRQGEMALLGEVPFGRYYGSVDSTPLFVLLAGAYYERTADLEFLRGIWPNIEAALSWIDSFGDLDGDGFVEYARQSESGLLQQGWKDSQDSVFHADGQIAKGPIALCEVQAYVYAAKTKIATVAEALGLRETAERLRSQAAVLQDNFERAFWADDLSMYALALDGDKRPCRVRSSNAGQCLFSGIASPIRHRQTKEALLSPALFSGWGVRTLATNERRYNPMSYHNGSVWPHDNAMIAFGDTASRDKRLATQILSGLLDLSIFTELHRLPELICGFPRHPGKAPTLYPVACSPQAWAAGGVFMVLQACLGLSIDAHNSRLYLYHTSLPEAVSSVRIRNLHVGNASIDLVCERYAETVGVNILRRQGDVEVIATK
jgi:glycogen debranching enzyme